MPCDVCSPRASSLIGVHELRRVIAHSFPIGEVYGPPSRTAKNGVFVHRADYFYIGCHVELGVGTKK